MDMILTGQPISAERAYQLGLVSTLADGDVLAAALERAQVIAGFQPETIKINLQTAHEAVTLHEDELWAANARAAELIFDSPNFKAGLAAFAQRDRTAVASRARS